MVNFGSSSLKNFYKYEYDSGLTFKFKNLFYEYVDKSNPTDFYNYEIVSFYRFVTKLTITSEGSARLNQWELPRESAIRPAYEEKLEELVISDIAKTIIVDLNKGEPLFFVESIRILTETNKIKIKLLTNKTKRELLVLLNKNVLTFNYYNSLQDLFFIIDQNIPPQTITNSTIIESNEDVKQIKKKFFSNF